jgi:hypothetical protein
MTKRLRLKAVDQDDLQIIAACLQDALIPLREMAFMAGDRRFMAAFNRFQWERSSAPEHADKLTLSQSALRVDHVQDVKYRGLDRDLDGVKFELLTLIANEVPDQGFDIALLFAGDIAIKLRVSELSLTLEDFGDPWAAGVTPRHDLQDLSDDEG